MATRIFTLALCGIAPRHEQMIKIMLSRVQAKQLVFRTVEGAEAASCQIALVDWNSPEAVRAYEAIRRFQPEVATVHLSDDGLLGAGKFRVARRSLLAQLLPALEEIVTSQLGGAEEAVPAGSSQPSAGATERGRGLEYSPAAIAAPTRPLTALVVDDSLAIRNQLQAALAHVGIGAELAATDEEAFAILHRRFCDVIFLDVILPGKDGYTICKELRRDPETKQTPVIMLTSRSSPFDRARGALAGCDVYLTKPVEMHAFYAAIDKTLMKMFKHDRAAAMARGYRPHFV